MDFGFNLNISAVINKEVEPMKVYDLLIIGAGPAGLNAALYAKRKGLNVGVVAERIGGQVLDTPMVENYLGTSKLSGEALMKQYEEHVKEYDVPISGGILVQKITNQPVKEVHASNGNVYLAKTLLLATGTMPRKLGIQGEDAFYGKGVSYCAICDGSFYTGQDVIVVGGGNSAVGAAIDLSRIAKSVTVIHRSQFRADKILLDRLYEQKNVTVLLKKQLVEIVGEVKVTGTKMIDSETKKEMYIPINGVFIEIGHIPKTACLKGILELDEAGEVVVSETGETSVEGIFAAGDVTTVPYKQIIIAAADGAKSALKASEYINRHHIV